MLSLNTKWSLNRRQHTAGMYVYRASLQYSEYRDSCVCYKILIYPAVTRSRTDKKEILKYLNTNIKFQQKCQLKHLFNF